MNEKIIEKLESLIERAIDRAASTIECRGGGLDGKDWHAEVEAIASLIYALNVLDTIHKNRTVLVPGMSLDLSTVTVDGVPIGRIVDLKSGSADCNPPYYVTARLASEIVAKAAKITHRRKRNIREDPEAFKAYLKNHFNITAE